MTGEAISHWLKAQRLKVKELKSCSCGSCDGTIWTEEDKSKRGSSASSMEYLTETG